jgi:hypothetical protein
MFVNPRGSVRTCRQCVVKTFVALERQGLMTRLPASMIVRLSKIP